MKRLILLAFVFVAGLLSSCKQEIIQADIFKPGLEIRTKTVREGETLEFVISSNHNTVKVVEFKCDWVPKELVSLGASGLTLQMGSGGVYPFSVQVSGVTRGGSRKLSITLADPQTGAVETLSGFFSVETLSGADIAFVPGASHPAANASAFSQDVPLIFDGEPFDLVVKVSNIRRVSVVSWSGLPVSEEDAQAVLGDAGVLPVDGGSIRLSFPKAVVREDHLKDNAAQAVLVLSDQDGNRYELVCYYQTMKPFVAEMEYSVPGGGVVDDGSVSLTLRSNRQKVYVDAKGLTEVFDATETAFGGESGITLSTGEFDGQRQLYSRTFTLTAKRNMADGTKAFSLKMRDVGYTGAIVEDGLSGTFQYSTSDGDFKVTGVGGGAVCSEKYKYNEVYYVPAGTKIGICAGTRKVPSLGADAFVVSVSPGTGVTVRANGNRYDVSLGSVPGEKTVTVSLKADATKKYQYRFFVKYRVAVQLSGTFKSDCIKDPKNNIPDNCFDPSGIVGWYGVPTGIYARIVKWDDGMDIYGYRDRPSEVKPDWFDDFTDFDLRITPRFKITTDYKKFIKFVYGAFGSHKERDFGSLLDGAPSRHAAHGHPVNETQIPSSATYTVPGSEIVSRSGSTLMPDLFAELRRMNNNVVYQDYEKGLGNSATRATYNFFSPDGTSSKSFYQEWRAMTASKDNAYLWHDFNVRIDGLSFATEESRRKVDVVYCLYMFKCENVYRIKDINALREFMMSYPYVNPSAWTEYMEKWVLDNYIHQALTGATGYKDVVDMPNTYWWYMVDDVPWIEEYKED